MTDDPIDDLVAACLERIEREGEAAIDVFCREHPRAADRVRSRLASLRAHGLLPTGAAATSRLPARLGDFTLLEPIGSGGMGVVHRARQESLQRDVALKLVHPEHLLFPGARERFRREADAASRLRHPAIVTVHASGEEQGIPFLAMELLDGRSLAEVLADLRSREPAGLTGADLWTAVAGPGPLSAAFAGDWPATCAMLAEQLAGALAHAHAHGVLHRDVKPSNVMLCRDGRVCLLDFGLARADGTTALTRTRSELGSLPYMAPEQARDAASADARTDVYGLGVTLYELLALRPPFAAASSAALRALVETGSAPPLASANPAVPYDLQLVVATAMERDPQRRYASAAALQADLRALRESRPIAARPLPRTLRARRWAQRHPALATAAALGFVVVPGLPTALWLQQRSATAEIQRERDAARASLGDALQAIERMLVHVGDQRLAQIPRMDPVRKALLEDALALQRRMLGDRRGAEDALAQLAARTQVSLGATLMFLGRGAEAQAELAAAAAALATRRALPAPPAELDAELARAEYWLGRIRQDAGDSGAAVAHLDRAVALYRTALARTPDSTTLQDRFAETLRGAAVLAARTNDRGGAARLAREGIELCERLAAAGSARAAPLTIASDLHAVQARIDGLAGDLPAAVTRLETALALLERARALEPDDLTIVESEIHQRVSLTVQLARGGRETAAVATVTRAIELARQLVRDHPRPHYQGDLAQALITRGNLRRRDDADGALADWRDAVDILEPLVARHDDMLDLASYCGLAHGLLGEAMQARGQHAAAQAPLERAVALHAAVAGRRPADATEQARLGLVQRRLALWHRAGGDHAAARSAGDRALAGYRAAFRLAPEVATYRADYRTTGLLLALLCAEAGAGAEGVRALRELHGDVGLSRRDVAERGFPREFRRLPEFEAFWRELPAEGG